jgi:hypothetical protein
MKKFKTLFFFLFASMLLSSCSCLLSQIPPQYIYAGAGCTAPLPDYKTQVIVTGGCTGFTVTQIPEAGTILSASNMKTSVTIRAVGLNQKMSAVTFDVTMIDTITPKITPLPSLMTYQDKQIQDMYDAADRMSIASFKNFDKVFPYDSLGGSPWPDSLYVDKMLVAVSLDSAGTGIRKRVVAFADSVVLDPSGVNWDDIINKPTDFPTSIHIHGWEQIMHPTYLDAEALKYPVDWRDFMDWQAAAEYMPIPARTPSGAPDMTLVDATINFRPLVFDPVALKMKFWNGSAWKTITSN